VDEIYTKLVLKVVRELRALLRLVDRIGVARKISEINEFLDSLSHLDNDLAIIETRLVRGLKSDPDKTPLDWPAKK
jgi:wyosine [tRNA(Phe)-imidazoG37] synthetase (radical SAM superfamily)